MDQRRFPRPAFVAGVLATALCAGPAAAAVTVERGPTTLENGDAGHKDDIRLRNDRLIVAIAAGTAPPWGVAPGGILDAAPVVNGKPLRDKVSLVDFIPNNWSSWPTTYQRFEIVEDSAERASVRVERDWEQVALVTTYTLEADSDRIHMVTTMTNQGEKAYEGLLSGYVLWPDGGHLFGPPGMHGAESGAATEAFADWSAAYDETWGFALHAPYVDHVDYDARDLYRRHDLGPGESRRFEGWLQVLPSGDLAPVLKAEIERRGYGSGVVSGEVATGAGGTVERPVVIVEKDGEPYAWTLGEAGRYQLTLPVGDYDLYATAEAHARSASEAVTVEPDSDTTVSFDDLKAPGQVRFETADAQTEEPLDTRIDILEGATPLIGFLGKTTYFTQLDDIGRRTVDMAPGKYRFKITHGEHFLARPVERKTTVETDTTENVRVGIERAVTPNADGWFAADMHHHSDVLDGFTPYEYVARSELAAGLDFLSLSDHDAMVNLGPLHDAAKRRNVPFIGSVEISPSWGHFNGFPITEGQNLAIKPGQASIDEIFHEFGRLGADAIQVNHPYIKYGYYTSLGNDAVPGGFNAGYDLVELNSDAEYERTLRKLWHHWNQGERYYLSAGTDVHDVWARRSGEIRLFAHVPGGLTPETFVAAAKQGHSFASMGPLVYPDVMFGSDLRLARDATATLGFDLRSVNGLQRIELIEGGEPVAEQVFDDAPTQARAVFKRTPQKHTWYSVRVEDVEGKKAWSNPVWVRVVTYEPAPAEDSE